MSEHLMDFSDRTGHEMYRLLAQRALEELSQESGIDRYTAMIGAAVIPVAEVLRNPLEKARDADDLAAEMVEIVTRQLLGLLEPVLQKRRNP